MFDRSPSRAAQFLSKVPEVTLAFWIIKIMSTTVGETGSDYLAVHVGLGTLVTDAITLALLIASLTLQFRAPVYVPWRYWLTVVLISVVGTQITDFFTDRLGVSLYVSTAVFAVALAVTFAVWYAASARSRSTASPRAGVRASTGWRSCSPSPLARRPATLPPRRCAWALS